DPADAAHIRARPTIQLADAHRPRSFDLRASERCCAPLVCSGAPTGPGWRWSSKGGRMGDKSPKATQRAKDQKSAGKAQASNDKNKRQQSFASAFTKDKKK